MGHLTLLHLLCVKFLTCNVAGNESSGDHLNVGRLTHRSWKQGSASDVPTSQPMDVLVQHTINFFCLFVLFLIPVYVLFLGHTTKVENLPCI